MSIIIQEKLSDNVFGAVWLAALILTYEEIVLKHQKKDISLGQSKIQTLAQKLCTKTVQSARVSQWCNGDHPNSSYNYLRAVGEKRKLTRIGEFDFNREFPTSLLSPGKAVFRIEGKDEIVTFELLSNWYKNEYSTGIYSGKQNNDNDSVGYINDGANISKPPIKSEEVGAVNSSTKEDVSGGLQEDSIKSILKAHLELDGWKTQLAMGKIHGIDIDACRGEERWIIEVKGSGSRDAMRVNYFLAILGETLQRMSDPNAKYSIALPDMKQFRSLWGKLPRFAKEKTGINALFVDANGNIEEVI